MKITMLGCGFSGGVPLIGCQCAVCTSENPKNSRTRASILVETQGKTLLIDTSPDLRQQALRHGIRHIDAVIYTHDHADHTAGLDELRAFNYLRNAEIPIYGDAPTLGLLQARYAYAFQPRPPIWFRPCLVPKLIEPGSFEVEGVPVVAFRQQHGQIHSLGLRFGDFAYSTDVNGLDEEAFAALEGVGTWVVDCLRASPSATHATLEMALGWIERVKPKRAVLTHMDHELDYDSLKGQLSHGVEPGYDGLILNP